MQMLTLLHLISFFLKCFNYFESLVQSDNKPLPPTAISPPIHPCSYLRHRFFFFPFFLVFKWSGMSSLKCFTVHHNEAKTALQGWGTVQNPAAGLTHQPPLLLTWVPIPEGVPFGWAPLPAPGLRTGSGLRLHREIFLSESGE